ncbi:hypothetical protein ZOSMA_258G00270 [Zostera marina]|uniref:Uncharacterized protein n=1 Tax=Zostera marina TaxID=29655 RepID=A0A0K9PFT5_ZOSMR|nr:hypothetical protein ZOSMA_258G00270 [Zostera marina]
MTVAKVFALATKLAGLLFTVSVTANSFAYSRFRKRNLNPFVSPIDESAEILADFNSGTVILNIDQHKCIVHSPHAPTFPFLNLFDWMHHPLPTRSK